MIKTLIFDFGDVFINLDKQGAMNNALRLFRMDVFEDDMISTNMQYEIGGISTTEFIRFYKNKFSSGSVPNDTNFEGTNVRNYLDSITYFQN